MTEQTAETERDSEIARTGRALVIVAHGKAWVLVWQAGRDLYEMISENGAFTGGFAPENSGFDMGSPPAGDGVYVCDLGWVDDGPGDLPGSREVVPTLKTWRLATPEEWDHHLKGEWAWEPEKGWWL